VNQPVRILLCEDDLLAKAWIATALRDGGFHVTDVDTVRACIQAVSDEHYDIAVLDVMMPGGDLDWIETKGGFATGIAVARRLRQVRPLTKIVGMSQSPAVETVQWFRSNADGFVVKAEILSDPNSIVERIRKVVDPAGWLKTCRTFIVHGHDHDTLEELKHHLQHTLDLSPPIVLGEMAAAGRTIIEKLDDYANVDYVFALMTPDETVAAPGANTRTQARPNVLLETGYFLGRLARKSGRVIVLVKGNAAVPSDLAGIGCIDISAGVAQAIPLIRREIDAGLKL
jgi:predicted nucleotide-binding protein